MTGLDTLLPSLPFIGIYLFRPVVIGIAALIAVLATRWKWAFILAVCAAVGEYLVLNAIVLVIFGAPWANITITPALHTLDFAMYPIAYLFWVSVFFLLKQVTKRWMPLSRRDAES